MANQKIWTYKLTNAVLVIDNSFNLTALSMVVTIGSAKVIGTDNCGGLPSTNIDLLLGIPLSVTTYNGINIIENLTIDATVGEGGEVQLIGIK